MSGSNIPENTEVYNHNDAISYSVMQQKSEVQTVLNIDPKYLRSTASKVEFSEIFIYLSRVSKTNRHDGAQLRLEQ